MCREEEQKDWEGLSENERDKKQAEELKAKGNIEYKKKNFANAHKFYSQAI